MESGSMITGRAGWRMIAAGVLCLAGACADQGPQPPAEGSLKISVAFTGIDIPQEAVVVVDSFRLAPIPRNAVVTHSLPAGAHIVGLPLLPANCTVQGANSRQVIVAPGVVREVNFTVICTSVTGVMEVSIATTGLDAPTSFSLFVGEATPGNRSPHSVLHMVVGGGSHAVSLAGLGQNCSVVGDNPRAVVVTTGILTRDTARTSFNVSCRASYGVVETTIETTGPDIDPNGVYLRIGDSTSYFATIPGRMLTAIGAGQHAVRIDSLASNCALATSAPPATITTGGQTRDTVRLTLRLTCGAVDKIAFTRYEDGEPWIYVAYADGSNAVRLAQGNSPSWSPTRTSLVFTSLDCSDYWYYYGCVTLGIAVIQTEGPSRGTITRLTNFYADGFPHWSPDGGRIVFASLAWLATGPNGDVMMMAANGTGVTTLVPRQQLAMSNATEPTWSPDGTRVVFTCEFGLGANTVSDICIINANGTGLAKLTNDSWSDRQPAWSPDGGTIAFESNRGDASFGNTRIAFMNPQGGDFTATVRGYNPTWSRDGTRIIFSKGGNPHGLFAMQRDGTALTQLTTGMDYEPNPRP